MVAVPEATPVSMPVLAPMPATPVLLLVHEPPETVAVSVVVLPAQIIVVPVIEAVAA